MPQRSLPPIAGFSPYYPDPPTTAEQQLIESVWLAQGVLLTSDDYAEIARDRAEVDQYSQRLRHEALRLVECDRWLYDGDIRQNTKVLMIVAIIAIGIASGGSFLAVGLAVAGVLLSKKPGADGKKSSEDQQFNQAYGIRDGGQLAIAGSPVPMLYGSRSLSIDKEGNECGGVRVGGMLLGTRIETIAGANYLYQLWALSTGASTDGIGQIRSLDTEKILFNNQERSQFKPEEIETQVRLGSENQSAMPWFAEYCQNVTPSSYNQFGVDRRAVVDQNSDSNNVSVLNGVNVSFDQAQSKISKSSGLNQWDAYCWSEESVKRDGFFAFTCERVGKRQSAGLSGIQKALLPEDLDYGFDFEGNEVQIRESGDRKGPARIYTDNTKFSLYIDPKGFVYYLIDGVLIYNSLFKSPVLLYANVLFYDAGSYFTAVNTSSQRGGIKGADVRRSSFTAEREDFERLAATDLYTLNNGQPGVDATSFRIIEKDAVARRCLTDSSISLSKGTEVFAYWTAIYATTKHISAIEFNFAFNVFARDESGKYEIYGVQFDVWVRKATEPKSADRRLARFYVRSSRPVRLNRAVRFSNFPLGRYVFSVRPQSRPQSGQDMWELSDDGQKKEDPTKVSIDGSLIKLSGEFTKLSTAGQLPSSVVAEMNSINRATVSSSQGATGAIASVNEIVLPSDIGIPENNQAHRYQNLALLGLKYEGSDRIQSNPGIAALVDECKEVRNLIKSGTSSGLSSSFVLNDPTESFDYYIGWHVRNLSQHKEGQIVAFTATTLTTDEDLNWQIGDRYLVFFVGASPFLPDTIAALALDKNGGVGNDVDADDGIDYPSFVKAREFCVLNKYYWNGIVEPPPTAVLEWIEEECRGSLLLAGLIDERWALFPEESFSGSVQVFNASNAKEFTQQYNDLSAKEVNRVVVRYRDGRDLFEEDGARFREKLVEIESRSLYDGAIAPVERVVDMPAVTSPLQAVDAAIALYNSGQTQDHTRTFKTSQQAAYMLGGSLVRVQAPSLEISEAYSGFVVEAEPFTNGLQRVRLRDQPLLYEGLTDSASTNGAVFINTNHSVTSVVTGDLLINKNTGMSSAITGVDDTHFYAAVECDRGDLIQVINTTAPLGILAAVTFQSTGNSQDRIRFDFQRRDDVVWLVFYGLSNALSVGDPVNIGPDDLYRVTSVQSQGKAEYLVECISHPGDMSDRAGLVIQYDNKTVFG